MFTLIRLLFLKFFELVFNIGIIFELGCGKISNDSNTMGSEGSKIYEYKINLEGLNITNDVSPIKILITLLVKIKKLNLSFRILS